MVGLTGTLGLLILIFITAVVCVRSGSKLQYNSLGFQPVRNHDDDLSDDDDDYFYGGQGRIKDWAPKTAVRVGAAGGGEGGRGGGGVEYRDSPSEDEGEDENSLFEKRLLKQ